MSSLPANRNVAVVLIVVLAGPEAIRVSGSSTPGPSSSGRSSTCQSYVAGVMSLLPAKSVARTSKWCSPSSTSLNEIGLVHSIQPSPSGGVSMSGGSPGFGGSRSGSTGSGSGSGSGSSRHSNSLAGGGEHAAPSGVSSVAPKTNVTSPPDGSGGACSITVTGAVTSGPMIAVGSADRQTTPRHCSGSALPVARLPPPSTLVWSWPPPASTPKAPLLR